jgi:hypothetical protein
MQQTPKKKKNNQAIKLYTQERSFQPNPNSQKIQDTAILQAYHLTDLPKPTETDKN